MMKQLQRRHGMTLMETMASMAILTIGISGAIAIAVDSSRAVSRSAHVQEATMLGQSLISVLQQVPWGYNTAWFTSKGNTNFADIETPGSPSNFKKTAVTAGFFDHCAESTPATSAACTGEITGTPLAAFLAPLPTGRTRYERYWNVANLPGLTNGVMIAVIIRWHEGSTWNRVVLLATRYQPQ